MTARWTQVRDPDPTVPGSRRLWTRAVTVLMAAVVLGTATLSMITEPPRLGAVSPGDGAVVGRAPAQVVLTFAGEFQPRTVHVTVADTSGRTMSDRPVIEGETVSVPVRIGEDGDYLVGYHIVLVDGQVLAGQTGFRITAGAADSAGPARAADVSTVAAEHAHVRRDPVDLALALLAVLLLGAMVTLMVRRPRPRV